MALKRIKKELLDLQKNPSTQFSAEPVNDNIFHCKAILIGPPRTPYENGKLHFSIFFRTFTHLNHQRLNLSQQSITHV